jgi:transcriptional regulator with XRE-family HTH domain
MISAPRGDVVRLWLGWEELRMGTGDSIRKIREAIRVRSADIERLSRLVADAKGNPEYYISHGTLADIEAGSIPSIYKLLSLAVALRISYQRLLSIFGLEVGDLDRFRAGLDSSSIQISSTDSGRTGKLPVQSWKRNLDRTDLVHGDLGEFVPAPIRSRMNPERYLYAQLGWKDDALGDTVPPGSLVEVDKEDTEVRATAWTSLRERPIFLIWRRDGYLCCWCHKSGSELATVPHPASRLAAERLRLPHEGHVLGRVISVWSPLVWPSAEAHESPNRLNAG